MTANSTFRPTGIKAKRTSRRDFALEAEARIYDENRAAWTASGHVGEFVLIIGSHPEFFPTLGDAYRAGIDRVGDTDFFVKRVTKEREVHTLPSSSRL
jgi:hypothetical protein